jgi:hypothetical protein
MWCTFSLVLSAMDNTRCPSIQDNEMQVTYCSPVDFTYTHPGYPSSYVSTTDDLKTFSSHIIDLNCLESNKDQQWNAQPCSVGPRTILVSRNGVSL